VQLKERPSMKFLCAVALLLLVAGTASAQTPVIVKVDSTVSFAASLDHDTTVTVQMPAGPIVLPLLSGYDILVFRAPVAIGATPVFQGALGKPAPDATNLIRQPFGWTQAQIDALASGAFVAQAVSIGSNGVNAAGVASDPFAVLASPRPPGKPGVAT
jgi:hypothetical protein